jgi:CxxC motif-containing protein (DUF1111 family)
MISRFAAATFLGLSSTAAYADPPDISAGHALFERQWTPSSSPTHAGAGLGPLYDAPSCSSCHAGGGPGLVSTSIGTGLLVRLGQQGGAADPVYGTQLQTKAVPGTIPEATVTIGWRVLDGRRIPSLHISGLGYGALDPLTYAALRRAPSLRGVAELESIPDDELLSLEAREHREGVGGRAAIVTDAQGKHVSRFGWKAAAADLTTQTVVALERDIGLSTSGRPDPWGECTPAEVQCRATASRNADSAIEVPDRLRDAIVAYVSSLPAPAAFDRSSHGYAIFQHIGCAACHTSLTAKDGSQVDALTDLLLHDMGPELNDGIGEGGAKSFEWRTAPLWNVADELAAGGLLHDGRARNIGEAVRWHGGEAVRARDLYAALSPEDLSAIDDYLLRK